MIFVYNIQDIIGLGLFVFIGLIWLALYFYVKFINWKRK